MSEKNNLNENLSSEENNAVTTEGVHSDTQENAAAENGGQPSNASTLSNEEQRLELAGRIYDLDKRTYEAVGSDLGRVFNDDRNSCVTRIAHYLKYSDLEHIVQSEMALIGNMGRTIEDKTLRKEIMRDYDQLLQDMKAIGRSFASYAILSEHRDGLSRLRKNVRRKEGNHLIICISRTYGCGASQIAMDLAESLRLNYYNAEIFKTVLARLEADQDGLQDEKFYMPHDGGAKAAGPAVPFEGEKRSLKDMIRKSYRYHGLSVRDAVFFNQSNLILELAKKESFVIVGRCADAILENNDIPHISIYITAPFEQRVHRIMSINHLSEKAAAKQIREVDKGHEKYYKYYTGRRWARASNYDLCFNSSTYGVDGSVNFILNVLKSNGVIVDTDIVSHPVPDIEPSAEQLAATEANEKMIQGE